VARTKRSMRVRCKVWMIKINVHNRPRLEQKDFLEVGYCQS
jgi:hypothetical protein